MWILLLYVLLVWVLLGAMMVAMLHAAKTLVEYAARAAEFADPMGSRSGAALTIGHDASERTSAVRASTSWPAPAAHTLDHSASTRH